MDDFFRLLFNYLPHPFIYHGYKIFRRKEFQSLQDLRKKPANKFEYSLQGFDEYNCIFVHIPKTGGVSLAHSLFGNLGGGHKTMSDYCLIFSPKEFEEYFKFAIVRNPWDRMVSAYFFLKEGGFRNSEKQWFEENLARYKNFEEFVFEWITYENIYSYYHFVPQHYFITRRQKIMVDQVYKLENISSAIADISKKLNTDLFLPHKNKSTTRDSDYRQYYNAKTKNIIGEIYRRDIELFNYSF